MAKKSKFKAGDRVWFTHAGGRFKKEGAVVHVRKDGLVIVHFDDFPPNTILVVEPYEVDPISTKKAYEAREATAAKTHHATKKAPAQLQREIDEALSRRSAPRHHHATRQADADTWDVAIDALLEHKPERAAEVVATMRKEHGVPAYAAINMDATPEFVNLLEETPTNVRDRFFKSLKALQDVESGGSPMLQFPRWKVDVTVGGDLVKTFHEVAPTAASAIGKAKYKMRGGRGFTIGDFKYKAKKTGQMSNVGHATRRGG